MYVRLGSHHFNISELVITRDHQILCKIYKWYVYRIGLNVLYLRAEKIKLLYVNVERTFFESLLHICVLCDSLAKMRNLFLQICLNVRTAAVRL